MRWYRRRREAVRVDGCDGRSDSRIVKHFNSFSGGARHNAKRREDVNNRGRSRDDAVSGARDASVFARCVEGERVVDARAVYFE